MEHGKPLLEVLEQGAAEALASGQQPRSPGRHASQRGGQLGALLRALLPGALPEPALDALLDEYARQRREAVARGGGHKVTVPSFFGEPERAWAGQQVSVQQQQREEEEVAGRFCHSLQETEQEVEHGEQDEPAQTRARAAVLALSSRWDNL